jgi:hypothetical protein
MDEKQKRRHIGSILTSDLKVSYAWQHQGHCTTRTIYNVTDERTKEEEERKNSSLL